jgi:hypothetical protein
MAAYGSNSFAVRFKREEVPEPEKKSAEMPPGGPQLSSFMPGGMEQPQPGRRRYPRGMKDQPWKSWLHNKKPGIKRKKKRSSLAALMG